MHVYVLQVDLHFFRVTLGTADTYDSVKMMHHFFFTHTHTDKRTHDLKYLPYVVERAS